MTDSIAIPSSSSSSAARQTDTQKPDTTNAAPSTPVAADLHHHSSSFYGSSMSAESSPASPFHSLQAMNGPRAPSSESSDSAVSRNADYTRKLSAREKGKMPARSRDITSESGTSASPSAEYGRRASFLSSSLSKSEHTVINVGEPDRPRLITCVKASQGFDWNPEIFLPSYFSDRHYTSEFERRQDPVEDIFITDEEAETMFPR